jgi:uncharacterized SAM-binding protein YcdF (DUF218 family)
MATTATGATPPQSKRKLRTMLRPRVLFPVLLLTIVIGLALLGLRMAGTWLIVEDPLQPARAVVVLGGQVPFRAEEAAAVYRQGWAHEVWLTQGGVFADDVALATLGIERLPEVAYSRQVLERLGVPSGAIRLLPGANQNTADEMRTIARELKASGGDRVIIITSGYHTRRVRVLWRGLAGKNVEAIVRYTRGEPFDSAHWWRRTGDAMAVSREWFGLLNAWAGFPMKSRI